MRDTHEVPKQSSQWVAGTQRRLKLAMIWEVVARGWTKGGC